MTEDLFENDPKEYVIGLSGKKPPNMNEFQKDNDKKGYEHGRFLISMQLWFNCDYDLLKGLIDVGELTPPDPKNINKDYLMKNYSDFIEL